MDAIDPATSNKQRDISRRRSEQFRNRQGARPVRSIATRPPSALLQLALRRINICKRASLNRDCRDLCCVANKDGGNATLRNKSPEFHLDPESRTETDRDSQRQLAQERLQVEQAHSQTAKRRRRPEVFADSHLVAAAIAPLPVKLLEDSTPALRPAFLLPRARVCRCSTNPVPGAPGLTILDDQTNNPAARCDVRPIFDRYPPPRNRDEPAGYGNKCSRSPRKRAGHD